ncbi:MAG: hypothetical protein ACRECR_01370 [Thermoplasmata archaeon]
MPAELRSLGPRVDTKGPRIHCSLRWMRWPGSPAADAATIQRTLAESQADRLTFPGAVRPPDGVGVESDFIDSVRGEESI